MTETQTRARVTKQDWRRHVLALVLFAVLVWYTVVSPSYTAAPLGASDCEPKDAEEREAQTRAARALARPLVGRAPKAHSDEFVIAVGEEEELDWPEIIGDD